MVLIRKGLSVVLLFLISYATVSAQKENEYRQTLFKMFEVSGTGQNFETAITQMFDLFKSQYTDVEAITWDELEAEFLNTSLDELTEMLEPVYAKYMTLEDLRQVIEFYESPVGKKLALNNPLIMQESMQIGQEWGRKIGEDLQEKMLERGY